MYTCLSEPQVAAYLERIGYCGEVSPSLSVLKKLVYCHSTSVPFENLDVYYCRKEPELTCAALYEKIVVRRRGGYCFELNGLFLKLLSALGFCAAPHIARIKKGDFLPPPSHEILIAELCGERYFVDVGFGGPAPSAPLKLIYDCEIECTSGRTYRFEKRGALVALQLKKGGIFSDMMLFSEAPCDEIDFLPLNAFCAYSPKEPFVHKPMAWLRTERGKVSIDGNLLRIECEGETAETPLDSSDKMTDALEKHFGITFAIK